jgi:hypothetical protein
VLDFPGAAENFPERIRQFTTLACFRSDQFREFRRGAVIPATAVNGRCRGIDQCRPASADFLTGADGMRQFLLSFVRSAVLLLAAVPAVAQQPDPTAARPLFNGRDLNGWEGDPKWFRVQDGAIVGGNLQQKIPHNFFLATKQEYSDFELTLEFRLQGQGTNAGIQLRSRRIPDHHEMIGYQADLGQSYWGALYDESRRNKILAAPDREQLAKVLKPEDWNRYRIRCEGHRIQLWINDLQTVDYTEQDQSLEQTGLIAVQIHGGPPGEAWYRNLQLRPLAAAQQSK